MNFPDSLRSLKRLPCLDGWRFVSICFVVLGHSEMMDSFSKSLCFITKWLPNGIHGVSFFFVISGFLITYLLLREKEKTATINLKDFYLRRILRIIPAYACFLVVIYILCVYANLLIPKQSWIALFTYTVNYITPPLIVSHIWSLSLEEQFYCIWPFIFWIVIAKKNNPRKALVILIIPLIVSPICRVISYTSKNHFPFESRSFLNHFDQLAIGCILSFLTAYYGDRVQGIFRKRKYILTFMAISLIVIPLVLTSHHLLAQMTVPFGLMCNGLGYAILIGLSIFSPNSLLFRWLEYRPIVSIGLMSYSIYLWQQIFWMSPKVFGVDHSLWFLSFPYWLIPVFVIAFLSYNLIEKPFLRLKKRLY